MICVPFRTVLIGDEDVYLTNEDCGVAAGSAVERPAKPGNLWLPSADCRGQVVYLVYSHQGTRTGVNVVTLPDDKIHHFDADDGFRLEMVGQHVLLVASGAGVWHVVASSNPVWLKR